MLKKITIILISTILASIIAIIYFFFLRELPKPNSIILHNILASIIGVGFIANSRIIQKKIGKITFYSLFLFAIGIAMLAIHIIKIFLTRC